MYTIKFILKNKKSTSHKCFGQQLCDILHSSAELTLSIAILIDSISKIIH